ncbi:MAG: PDZ domain-containing protein [Candidatus Hydrogenedentes bacterium]|nr:PDZ domain-containing protein [Candidatus Hydrogenedentota bacterium]
MRIFSAMLLAFVCSVTACAGALGDNGPSPFTREQIERLPFRIPSAAEDAQAVLAGANTTWEDIRAYVEYQRDTAPRYHVRNETFRFFVPAVDGSGYVSNGDVELRDKTLVVAILGSWSQRSIEFVPILNDIAARAFRDKVRVLGIAIEPGPPESHMQLLQQFQADRGVTFPLLYGGPVDDVEKTFPDLLNFTTLPKTFVIAPNGRVAWVENGVRPDSANSLANAIGRAGEMTGVPEPHPSQRSKRGIGVLIGRVEPGGLMVIIEVLPQTPAEEVGLTAGDVIVEVDGTKVAGKELGDVASLIRGDTLRAIDLKVAREGVATLTAYTIVRRELSLE